MNIHKRSLSLFFVACAFLSQASGSALLVNSQSSNSTRVYDGDFSGPLAGGGFGIATDSSGNIYVVDSNGRDVLKYSSTGNPLGVFVSLPEQELDVFNGISFGSDGRLYAATQNSDRVYQYDASGSSRTTFVTAGSGGLSSPYGIAFDSLGLLYVAGFSSNQIHRYDSSGASLGAFTSGTTLNGPIAPVFVPDGFLYVADFFNNRIVRFDGTTGEYVATLAATDDLDGPNGLAFGPNGALYVTSTRNDRILQYDYTTDAYVGVFMDSSTDSGLLSPTYIRFATETPQTESPSGVPEPGTFGIAGGVLGCIGLVRFRRNRQALCGR